MSIGAIVAKLHDFYGPVSRPPHGLFAFVVWEVISAGNPSARRDLAWQALHRIPALTPDAMYRAKPASVSEALSTLGSSRDERLAALREAVFHFRRHRELEHRVERPASLLDAVRALTTIPGLDRAARDRALLFVSGFRLLPVDRGVARVGARMGLAASDGRRAVRQSLTAQLSADDRAYQQAAIYLAHHAEHACTAVAPHCTVCPLREACPAAR